MVVISNDFRIKTNLSQMYCHKHYLDNMLVVSSRHRNTAFTFAHVVIVQRNMYGVRLSIYDFYLNRFPRRTYRRTRLDDSGTVFQNSVGNSIIFYFRTIVIDAKQVLDLLVFVCVFVDRKRTTRSTRYLFYFLFFFLRPDIFVSDDFSATET